MTFSGWLRYDVVRRIIEELQGIESVLEIGAGEGALGTRLATRYRYLGLEPDRRSFETAERRLRGVANGSVRNMPVEQLPADSVFDLICAFEVLEHIEQDRAALGLWRRHLRPGGWIVISVPAWSAHWGAADEKAGHYRRYEPAEIEELLQDAGFSDPRALLYGFPLGYLIKPILDLAARRSLRRGASIEERTSASGRWLQPPDRFGRLTQLLSAPFRLLQRPFVQTRLGTGLVAYAQRPKD